MAIQNVLNISHRSSGFLKLFAKNATDHFITHKIFFLIYKRKRVKTIQPLNGTLYFWVIVYGSVMFTKLCVCTFLAQRIGLCTFCSLDIFIVFLVIRTCFVVQLSHRAFTAVESVHRNFIVASCSYYDQ